MKIVSADFYKEFHCLAGACPDSCCRQGWQIVLDEEHRAMYENLVGPLGEAVRSALVYENGECFLQMQNGVCSLLQDDGLCPIAKELGEEGLCHICHTHPRFLEEYGGVREVHLSLSCPAVQELLRKREVPISFVTEQTDEPLSGYNSIDPEEYLSLLELRDACIRIAQDRTLYFYDRMALILELAKRAQNHFDAGEFALCKPLCQWFSNPVLRERSLVRSRRCRLKGTSFFPERELLLSLEHLTEEFPRFVRDGVFCARDGKTFDENCQLILEHLLVLYLAHYIPKAVCDGRADTKIRFAVLMILTARRLCLCQKQESAEEMLKMAGLLAKEVEHCPENMDAVYSALQRRGWHAHLLTQLPLKKEKEHAI